VSKPNCGWELHYKIISNGFDFVGFTFRLYVCFFVLFCFVLFLQGNQKRSHFLKTKLVIQAFSPMPARSFRWKEIAFNCKQINFDGKDKHFKPVTYDFTDLSVRMLCFYLCYFSFSWQQRDWFLKLKTHV